MAYTKTNWQDLPSTSTPVNATNLNKMETGIEDAHKLVSNGILATITGNNVSLTSTDTLTLTLVQQEQVGNYFSISGGGIKCSRAGWLEISAKVHFQSVASGSTVRWLQVSKNTTQVSASPTVVSGRTTLTSPPTLVSVSANDIIYLQVSGAVGDTIRVSYPYTSIYVRYIS